MTTPERDPLEVLRENMRETARTTTDPAELEAMARVWEWVLHGDPEPVEEP